MIKIEVLELSPRTYNALKNNGINFIHQIIQTPDSKLLNFKNFGLKSLYEIKYVLNNHNLKGR